MGCQFYLTFCICVCVCVCVCERERERESERQRQRQRDSSSAHEQTVMVFPVLLMATHPGAVKSQAGY